MSDARLTCWECFLDLPRSRLIDGVVSSVTGISSILEGGEILDEDGSPKSSDGLVVGGRPCSLLMSSGRCLSILSESSLLVAVLSE